MTFVIACFHPRFTFVPQHDTELQSLSADL